MSKCSGFLYAKNATRDTNDKWLIVEVDVPSENFNRLLPDEAYGAALAWLAGETQEQIIEREKEYRKNLEQHRDEWAASLDMIGNVAYESSIAPDCISRYCVVDAQMRHEFVSVFIDAVQHRPLFQDILLPYFLGVTAWLFGDRPFLPTPPDDMTEELGSIIIRESSDRRGISVEDVVPQITKKARKKPAKRGVPSKLPKQKVKAKEKASVKKSKRRKNTVKRATKASKKAKPKK